VVVVGGHIDSWDVGQGAMDDGGGSVAAWEAVRLMHALGLRPRRTVRVVLWTNEENGLAGARAYRDAHASELEKHVLAIESDGGVFQPKTFELKGSDRMTAAVRQVVALLKPIGVDSVQRSDGTPAWRWTPAGTSGITTATVIRSTSWTRLRWRAASRRSGCWPMS
jgi:carboxypeptidase Q